MIIHLLKTLLEYHAPIKTRTVTIRPAAPWYSDDIRREKEKRSKLERLWRRNKLTINRENYVEQYIDVKKITDTRMKFHTNIIQGK